MSVNRILVIAEAGVNHNGDIALAKCLIDVAADAGADFVKFQTFDANRLVTRTARKAGYQLASSDANESQYQMLCRLQLSSASYKDLILHAADRKVGIFSTGFDIESNDLLASLGQDRFKIPSGEITNLPYLRHIGGMKQDVILSTGMATMGEIESAVKVLEEAGTPRAKVTVLHCTTEYPTPMSEVNLRAMQSIRTALGVEVGYSDHTPGIEVAIAAAALGATIIEKHFTLDRELPGPDHKASLEQDELKAMVAAIRNVEIALGNGVKRPTPSEVGNIPVVRKSLVARKNILKGEAFSADNITAKRPGTGISPMRWDAVIGRSAPRDFSQDELIEL
jgi:N,N'-diacetyllegionaminate synthase